mgnify:CR=1 FL=1
MRLVKLAQILEKENNQIYILGLEKAKELENSSNMRICRNLEQVLENAEIVISSIPFTRDGITINMPLSDNKIKINEFMNLMKDKTLIAGTISNNIYEKYKDVEIIDIMKNEKLAILNTIATAEGAIKEIIENTQVNVHGSKIMILGFGRVGKTLAKKLDGLSAKITVVSKEEEELAWAEVYGYTNVQLNKIEDVIKDYDVIVNTIPHIILQGDILQKINKDTLLLDLASGEGGINKEEAQENKINLIKALGIPGKISPITTAKILKETIYEILEEKK